MWKEDISHQRQIAPYLPWEFSQPNGLKYQQCVAIVLTTGQIGDQNCNTKKYCSLCAFNGSVKFHIRGLPETSPIDTDYIFVPNDQRGNRMRIMGYRQHEIRWIYENDSWEIFDRSKLMLGTVIGSFKDSQYKHPIGMGIWKITSGKKSSRSMPLKLSKV